MNFLDGLPSLSPVGREALYGQWGDYIGGIWGTVLSLGGLIALIATLAINRRSDQRNSTLTILSELLKTHDQIISAWDGGYLTNKGAPARFLSEFYSLYALTKKINETRRSWSVDDMIDIAYTFTYYGPNSHADDALVHYGNDLIKIIHDHIPPLRRAGKGEFKGFQLQLAHYMRNLFAAYSTIHRSKLPKNQRKALGKIVRAKLSNYEQSLLTLNIISHVGRSWELDGLVTAYKPITNVPKNFFSFDDDFNLKERFPQIRFEWESVEGQRPWYRRITVFGWNITVSR